MNEFKKFAFLTPHEKNTRVDGKEKGMGLEAKGRRKLGGLSVKHEVLLMMNDLSM